MGSVASWRQRPRSSSRGPSLTQGWGRGSPPPCPPIRKWSGRRFVCHKAAGRSPGRPRQSLGANDTVQVTVDLAMCVLHTQNARIHTCTHQKNTKKKHTYRHAYIHAQFFLKSSALVVLLMAGRKCSDDFLLRQSHPPSHPHPHMQSCCVGIISEGS